MLRILRPEKIHRLQPDLKRRTLDLEASTLPETSGADIYYTKCIYFLVLENNESDIRIYLKLMAHILLLAHVQQYHYDGKNSIYLPGNFQHYHYDGKKTYILNVTSIIN